MVALVGSFLLLLSANCVSGRSLSLQDFNPLYDTIAESNGVITIPHGHIESKKTYQRPMIIEAEMRSPITSECNRMTLNAADIDRKMEISHEIGAYGHRWIFNPGNNQGDMGSVQSFRKVKLELDANTEVKFYIDGDLKYTTNSNFNSGYLRFVRGCTDLEVRNIKIIDYTDCTVNGCGSNAECIDVDGNNTCQCKVGFSGDASTSCTDIDECITNPCASDANCTNLPGNYSCSCKSGFTGNGMIFCADINECNLNQNACSNNAECTNLPGNYTCSCKTGYTGNGMTSCTDIDECTSNTTCGQNANCTNTFGNYTCSCKDGYSGDPYTSCNLIVKLLGCQNDQMTFTLLKSDSYKNVKNVSFLDTSCQATETATSYVLNTKFGFCQTSFSVETHYIVYHNYVIITYGGSTSDIISREKIERVDIKCHMPRNLTFSKTSPSFKTNMTITVSTTSFGDVSLSLPMYKDGTFQESYLPTDFPVTQDQNDDINLKLLFDSTVGGLKMVPQECFATATADINSPLKYHLIKDRCPKDETLQYTLQHKEIQMAFEPFNFLVDNDGIFIHCGAVICSTTSNDPICQFNVGCNARRRRGVILGKEETSFLHESNRDRRETTSDHSESFYVATGYITIKDKQSQDKNRAQPEKSGSTTTNLLIAGVCILSLIAILIGFKSVRQRISKLKSPKEIKELSLEKVKASEGTFNLGFH